MTPLSTISTTAVETVTAADARRAAWASSTPEASNGRGVKPYPNRKASPTESAIVGKPA